MARNPEDQSDELDAQMERLARSVGCRIGENEQLRAALACIAADYGQRDDNDGDDVCERMRATAKAALDKDYRQ